MGVVSSRDVLCDVMVFRRTQNVALHWQRTAPGSLILDVPRSGDSWPDLWVPLWAIGRTRTRKGMHDLFDLIFGSGSVP